MEFSASYRAKLLFLAVLFACSILFVAATWHWPLSGDAALMHYISFLGAHGYKPYASIDDVNLPAALLPDFVVQRLFGPSPIAWRIYDLSLLSVVGLGCWLIAKKTSRFAALWAALLFALIHARDGIEQTGQRDLAATPFLLFATAAILRAYEERRPQLWFLAGILGAIAISIKPTLVFFLAVPFLFLLGLPGIKIRTHTSSLLCFLSGVLLPLGVQIGWLFSISACSAFLQTERYRAPFHAHLGHAGLTTLLHHALSPISFLASLALVLVIAGRKEPNPRSARTLLLLLACGASLLSFVLQGKGYPYHRYPFLAFALLLIALELADRTRTGDWRAYAAWAGLAWSTLVLAPLSVWKAAHYDDPEREVVARLKLDLNDAAQAEHLANLSRNVQCFDSVNGCIETLERIQLVQSTGHLYDEFFFNPANAYTAAYRSNFLQAIAQKPPAVVVVMSNLFPEGPGNYTKLETWPEFKNWLSQNYILFVQRTPEVPVKNIGGRYLPPGYRVYIRRPAA